MGKLRCKLIDQSSIDVKNAHTDFEIIKMSVHKTRLEKETQRLWHKLKSNTIVGRSEKNM